MKVNVKIAGASYNGVPSVLIPLQAGGTATFCEVSDTTATAADVATGKKFYTAAGELATGTKPESTGIDTSDATATAADILSGKTAYIDGKKVTGGLSVDSSGNVIIQSADAWGIQVTQTAHQTITATPKFTTVEANGKYRSNFSADVSISANTGYSPGTIKKGTDSVNHMITVTASAAEEIAGMVEDGWAKVYEDGASFYSDDVYTTKLSALAGDILVAGMKTGNLSNLSFLNSYLYNNKALTKFKSRFLTSAGNYLLYDCTHLTSVDLGNLTSAGNYLLYGCTHLTSVDLGNLTSADNSLLRGCTSLTSVDLGNLTSAGNFLLSSCTSLTSVDLGNLTSAGYSLLQGCTRLTSVDLGNLTSAGNSLLYGCTSLTSVDLGNLTSVGNFMLDGCQKLQSCTIHSTTPPTIHRADGPINDTCVLYVPAGCVDAYKANSNINTLFGGRIKEIGS